MLDLSRKILRAIPNISLLFVVSMSSAQSAENMGITSLNGWSDAAFESFLVSKGHWSEPSSEDQCVIRFESDEVNFSAAYKFYFEGTSYAEKGEIRLYQTIIVNETTIEEFEFSTGIELEYATFYLALNDIGEMYGIVLDQSGFTDWGSFREFRLSLEDDDNLGDFLRDISQIPSEKMLLALRTTDGRNVVFSLFKSDMPDRFTDFSACVSSNLETLNNQ